MMNTLLFFLMHIVTIIGVLLVYAVVVIATTILITKSMLYARYEFYRDARYPLTPKDKDDGQEK